MVTKNYYYLLLFITLSTVAQTRSSQDYANTSGKFSYFSIEAPKEETVSGSPYQNDVYMPAVILGYNEVTPPMRYHAEKDEIEFVRDEKRYYVLKSDSLEVKIFSKTYKFLQYETRKGEEKGYLVILLNDNKSKFSLYKKEKITLVPSTKSTTGYGESRSAYYRKEDDKFYLAHSGKISFMPTKKKEVFALMPNHTEALEKYIKEKKISFENENNLVDLVRFMNTLNN